MAPNPQQNQNAFADCRILPAPDEQDGLRDGQTMHRHKNGPPVFASSITRDAAWGPAAGNPHNLHPVCVKLRVGLAQQEYEDHYVRVFNLCMALEQNGIFDTGIYRDGSIHDLDWYTYHAVFDRATMDEVKKDVVVQICGAWDPENRRRKAQ
ncbi:hypothetical protein BJ508DRAFT_417406 [Ascobolus immersus RN42]|uniref:Uncharacterized protein n=1 Tax=Ascobolus immersus RN42 TaxID=1160509 RepID=A0A3N4HTA9_ASCIM|nr:hypothetical protein BJ508DRAFT_417406 [Ascobolus immersus RN42]